MANPEFNLTNDVYRAEQITRRRFLAQSRSLVLNSVFYGAGTAGISLANLAAHNPDATKAISAENLPDTAKGVLSNASDLPNKLTPIINPLENNKDDDEQNVHNLSLGITMAAGSMYAARRIGLRKEVTRRKILDSLKRGFIFGIISRPLPKPLG